ncbi:MAG: PIN domain-containing protein [Polaromonas sp.]
MRLLIDINVILDVIFQRPGQASSSALMSNCSQEHQAWLAWHSVATLSYLIERQQNAKRAHEAISELLTWAQVAATSHADALMALQLPMADFEDAMQASAAMACSAQYIITRNVRDFAKSPVPAITPEGFLQLRAL